MKLNKTFGRIATTLVATAMLASVAAVPAFAVSIGSDGTIKDQEGLTEVTFTKVYQMPEHVTPPDITFTYAVEGAAPTDDDAMKTDNDKPADSANVSEGTGNITSVTIDKDDFNKVTEDDDTIDTYEAEVKLTLPAASSYAGAGIYKYTVTESKDGDDNNEVTMGGTHTLYVYVENGSTGNVITGVEFWDAAVPAEEGVTDGDPSKKTNEWVNYYKLSGNPDDPDNPDNPPTPTANELTVAKRLDGEMANMSEKFDFTITTNAANDLTYTLEKYVDTDDEDTTPDTWQWQQDLTSLDGLELGNNERVHIYGLIKGDTFSIAEDAANSNGYETSVAVNATEDESLFNQVNGQTLTFGSDGMEGNIEVTYTNYRDAVSPTGLIMDIAPYVLLVVVAAAGCFVFLRKRRED